jgi:predicted nucleic acid-binding protein
MNWSEIGNACEAIRSLCGEPVPETLQTHEVAFKIAGNYGFNIIYDLLMIAAAQMAGCTTFYTEDMQHGQSVGP